MENKTSHMRLIFFLYLHTKQKVAHTEENVVGVSFLQRSTSSSLQLYQKETPTQVFSCEICEIFKNTYFEEHLRTTTSAHILLCCIILICKLETN